MFRIESRGGAGVVWRQSETSEVEPTGSYAPRGKWSSVGRGFRSRSYAHVSEGEASGTDNLTATGITTGQPTIASPTIGAASGSVDLIALGFVSGSPVLGSAALGQIHVISAQSITSAAPIVGHAALNGADAVLGSIVGTVKKRHPMREPRIQRGNR